MTAKAPAQKNIETKKARKAADLQLFVKLYGRKAQRGVEPNDRRHDHAEMPAIRRMNPVELDRLLREADDD